MARTYVVTGSASGLGAATRDHLRDDGHRMIGVDVHDAEIVADLGAAAGRQMMIDRVRDLSGGVINGVIACAGIGGGEGSPVPIIRVNYFGALASLEGLRPFLARGTEPRVRLARYPAVVWHTTPSGSKRLVDLRGRVRRDA